MITTKTIYELHDVEITLKLKEIEDRLKVIIKIRTKILIWLKYNTKIRNMVFNKDKYLNNEIALISLPINSIEKYYNLQLSQFTSFNKEIKDLEEKKENILKLKIDENTFTNILGKFNSKVVDAIINEDYKFNHVFIGTLKKHISKRSKPFVDWSKSNKNKEKLLQENKIPAYKKDRLEAEEKGLEYKGEEWLEYLSPYNFYFDWVLTYAQTIRIFNIKNFKFIPYRGENSSTMKLHNYRNTFTEDQLINQYNTLKDAN